MQFLDKLNEREDPQPFYLYRFVKNDLDLWRVIVSLSAEAGADPKPTLVTLQSPSCHAPCKSMYRARTRVRVDRRSLGIASTASRSFLTPKASASSRSLSRVTTVCHWLSYLVVVPPRFLRLSRKYRGWF